MTASSPIRTGGVTYQWRLAAGRWELTHARTCVAEVIPDGRYPAMYRLKFHDEPISDMVNLTRAKEAALRRIGSKRAAVMPESSKADRRSPEPSSPHVLRRLEHFQMRFFKYVTADTARKILEGGTLLWSHPTKFNDPFDAQFDLHLEFDEATIIDLVVDELWKLYSGQKKLEPANVLGQVFELFLSRAPGLSRDDIFERQGLRDAIIESIKLAEARLPELHAHQ